MSGVYIKGMEIPTSCADCELAEHYERYGQEHFCPFMGWYADYEKCPLIPVPDHGRLIDADAFREEMDKHYPFDKFTQSKHGEADAAKGTIIMMLANAPTIIPADKEADNENHCRQDSGKPH